MHLHTPGHMFLGTSEALGPQPRACLRVLSRSQTRLLGKKNLVQEAWDVPEQEHGDTRLCFGGRNPLLQHPGSENVRAKALSKEELWGYGKARFWPIF